MSKITKIWKRGLRPRLLAAVRRNVVPAPISEVTAAAVVESGVGAEYIVRPSRTTSTLPPRTIVDVDGQLEKFFASASTHAWGSEIAEVTHRDFAVAMPGRIAGNDGAVISSSNELVGDLSGVSFRSGDILDPLSTGKLASPTTVAHPVALVTCWRSDNYYHWLIDGVARLRHLESSLTPDTRLYAPGRKRFQVQSIASLGFRPDQIVTAKYGSHIASQRIMAAASRTQSCSRADCDYLHQRFTSQLTCEPNERIFLSRRKRGVRSLVNEREIFAGLKPLGFRRVLLEDLAFDEQVKLFNSAEVVVAPHGAGLANLVFARAGTRVLEITTPFRLYGYHCFYELAHYRSLNYRALVAKPINARDVDLNQEPGDSDIYVAPQHVVEQVHQMLADNPLQRAARQGDAKQHAA